VNAYAVRVLWTQASPDRVSSPRVLIPELVPRFVGRVKYLLREGVIDLGEFPVSRTIFIGDVPLVAYFGPPAFCFVFLLKMTLPLLRSSILVDHGSAEPWNPFVL